MEALKNTITQNSNNNQIITETIANYDNCIDKYNNSIQYHRNVIWNKHVISKITN
jgi:hypothetical protein